MANDPWSARIDWPKVLDDIAYLLGEPQAGNDLLRTPVSEKRLAEALQRPRMTVKGWLDGSEPRHSDGEVIITHWERLTGKARTFIYIDRYVYSAAKATGVKRRTPGEHGEARLVAA